MQIVTKPYATAFLNFAQTRPDVLCLTADLTSSCEVDSFRDRCPERFFSMGMTEQNLLSFSSGLAMEGFRPFIHTFSVFLYRRPYDQLVNSIAYPNRHVRLMGFLPGITTPGGATHQAIEDIAVLRSLPNMTVLETGDATEVETVLTVADAIDGPVYVRVLRGLVPRLFTTPYQFNELRTLNIGTDVLIVSTGITTEEALRATNALTAAGVSVTHLHVSTIKPFATSAFLDAVTPIRYGIVTVENHTVIGGLGSLVAEILADAGIGKKLRRLGLADTFAHGASRPYLMRKYQFDAVAIVAAVEQLMGIKTAITVDTLQALDLEPIDNAANAEDL